MWKRMFLFKIDIFEDISIINIDWLILKDDIYNGGKYVLDCVVF